MLTSTICDHQQLLINKCSPVIPSEQNKVTQWSVQPEKIWISWGLSSRAATAVGAAANARVQRTVAAMASAPAFFEGLGLWILPILVRALTDHMYIYIYVYNIYSQIIVIVITLILYKYNTVKWYDFSTIHLGSFINQRGTLRPHVQQSANWSTDDKRNIIIKKTTENF